jgi:hypothetical protein
MPKLVEGQPARLDVGESLACRIIGFNGPDVVLALETEPQEEIADGASAYLLLESEGRLSARPRTARSSCGSPTTSGSASAVSSRARRSRCQFVCAPAIPTGRA